MEAPQVPPDDGILQAGKIKLNHAQRRVWCGGKEIHLPRHPYELLHALMLARGNALSRDILCQVAFGHAERSNALAVAAHRLRKMLGEEARKRIVTLEGFGMRMDMDDDPGNGGDEG